MAPPYELTYNERGRLDLTDLPQTEVNKHYAWTYKCNMMDWTRVETAADAALVHIKCHFPDWSNTYCDHEGVKIDGNVLVVDDYSYGTFQTRAGNSREYWTQLPAHLEQYKRAGMRPSFVHFDVLPDGRLHAKQFQIGGGLSS
jgi:hypothetical protein